jgi:multimeric flavodoxin WrbA
MSKNIVILSGSPREGGNTDKLVAAFIEGAKSAGNAVTLFRVADMKIGGCLGCHHCFEEKGVCIQKDDMPQIVDALRKAEVMVLASPVYFFGVTAQLKLSIDRTFVLLAEERPTKRAALLMTAGRGGADACEGAIAMYSRMCKFSGWDPAGVVIAGGLQGKDDINGRGELEEARALGKSI